ncbi:MAG TPA: penicillin-binding protein activator LpoB, partial [Caldithrix abyssi]|nr:penicillin-binding protein activator LpoB [Caldithrix abyssi]
MPGKKRIISSFFILIILSFIFNCSGPTRTVKRVQVDEAIDISGHWNDTDARMTAESMVQD